MFKIIADFFGFLFQGPRVDKKAVIEKMVKEKKSKKVQNTNICEKIKKRHKYLMETPTETWDHWQKGKVIKTPYLVDYSCNVTVERIAKDLALDSINEVFRWDPHDREIAGDTFMDIDKKLKWIKDNPKKGVFLGAYIFDKNETLKQVEKTGDSKIDKKKGFGLALIQEYLDKGAVLISWTPYYKALPESMQKLVGRKIALDKDNKPKYDKNNKLVYNGYEHPHIAYIIDQNSENYLKRGPLLAMGGITADHWEKQSQNGLFDQRWTTSSSDEYRRPFYIFAFYQGD